MARWYRAYEGTVSDPKLAEVALAAGCSRALVIAVWHSILEACAHKNEGGRFDLPPRRVAAVLCEPISSIESVFSGLSELGLLCDGEVTAWSRRQFESDTSTERSRRHRERLRNADATLHDVSNPLRDADASPPENREHRTEKEERSLASLANRARADEAPPKKPCRPDDWPSDYREQFWTAYPNKVGKPRALAKLEGVAKRGKTRWADLMGGLRRYIADKPPDRQWCNPETWLNQERWGDQPANTLLSVAGKNSTIPVDDPIYRNVL